MVCTYFLSLCCKHIYFIIVDDRHVPDENNTELKDVKYSAYSIENVAWFIASCTVFYYTEFPVAVWYDPRVKR